jgi:sRNA-binding regulator protein Hfq
MDLGSGRKDRAIPVQISSAQMIRYRDQHDVLEFNLNNGSKVTGDVTWFDDFAFNVRSKEHGEITLMRHAVLFYRVQQQ